MKKAFSVAGTRIVSTIAQGLTFLILTQSLGPASFGAFATITVAFGFASSLVGFGSGALALRVQSLDKPASLAASLSVLRYVAVILAATMVSLVSVFVFEITQEELLIAGILFGALEASHRAAENILFGLEHTKRAQFAMVFRRIVVLLAVIVGFFKDMSLEVLIATLGVLLIFSPFWLFRVLARPMGLKHTVRLSLPYWGADLLSKLQTLDVVIANLVIGPVGVGVYAAASRISSPLNILASSVLSVLTPELSRQRGSSRLQASHRSMKFLGIVSISLILLSPAIGLLLEWILGPGYEGLAWPAAVLCISAGFAAVNQGQVAYLYAAGEARRLFLTRLWVIPLAMLSGIPLGLTIGITGVALAVCLSQMLQVGVLRWQVKKAQAKIIDVLGSH